MFERYPRITKAYKTYSTEGMALGVYEEFIPFFGISLLAYYYPNMILCTIWFALMLSLAVHFAIHIALCIFIRKYIPSLITSIICLPVSILIIYKCIPVMKFDWLSLVVILVTAAFMMQYPGTTPISINGKIIYGIIAGLLAFFISGEGTSPIGMA